MAHFIMDVSKEDCTIEFCLNALQKISNDGGLSSLLKELLEIRKDMKVKEWNSIFIAIFLVIRRSQHLSSKLSVLYTSTSEVCLSEEVNFVIDAYENLDNSKYQLVLSQMLDIIDLVSNVTDERVVTIGMLKLVLDLYDAVRRKDSLTRRLFQFLSSELISSIIEIFDCASSSQLIEPQRHSLMSSFKKDFVTIAVQGAIDEAKQLSFTKKLGRFLIIEHLKSGVEQFLGGGEDRYISSPLGFNSQIYFLETLHWRKEETQEPNQENKDLQRDLRATERLWKIEENQILRSDFGTNRQKNRLNEWNDTIDQQLKTESHVKMTFPMENCQLKNEKGNLGENNPFVISTEVSQKEENFIQAIRKAENKPRIDEYRMKLGNIMTNYPPPNVIEKITHFESASGLAKREKDESFKNAHQQTRLAAPNVKMTGMLGDTPKDVSNLTEHVESASGLAKGERQDEAFQTARKQTRIAASFDKVTGMMKSDPPKDVENLTVNKNIIESASGLVKEEGEDKAFQNAEKRTTIKASYAEVTGMMKSDPPKDVKNLTEKQNCIESASGSTKREKDKVFQKAEKQTTIAASNSKVTGMMKSDPPKDVKNLTEKQDCIESASGSTKGEKEDQVFEAGKQKKKTELDGKIKDVINDQHEYLKNITKEISPAESILGSEEGKEEHTLKKAGNKKNIDVFNKMNLSENKPSVKSSKVSAKGETHNQTFQKAQEEAMMTESKAKITTMIKNVPSKNNKDNLSENKPSVKSSKVSAKEETPNHTSQEAQKQTMIKRSVLHGELPQKKARELAELERQLETLKYMKRELLKSGMQSLPPVYSAK